MRSTKRDDLDGVVAKFERWRKDRPSRAIPDELWDLAVGLLDEHSATDICRALGLNHSRFKEARAERVVRRRRRVAARRRRSGVSRKASEFVELMPVRLGLGPRLLAPCFERPGTWRGLNGAIGVVRWRSCSRVEGSGRNVPPPVV